MTTNEAIAIAFFGLCAVYLVLVLVRAYRENEPHMPPSSQPISKIDIDA